MSKIADYGVKVLLAISERPKDLHTASKLALVTHISLPMVSKILKILTKGKLLLSKRGSRGGYQLRQPANETSLAQIVSILDGDIAMTECEHHTGCCAMEANCTVKENWFVISKVINDVLQNISLQQMHQPLNMDEAPLTFIKRAHS